MLRDDLTSLSMASAVRGFLEASLTHADDLCVITNSMQAPNSMAIIVGTASFV